MLQQTRVAAVIDYFNRFVRRFPDIFSLAAAELEEVLKLWEGLGYYSRARHLHQAARKLIAAGEFQIPKDPERFSRLPGVGPYITAAVQSIAFGHQLSVVDGNVKRVLARLLLMADPVNQSGAHGIYQETASKFLYHKDPGTFNQALMELGAMICKPRRPLCQECPVHDFCRAARTGRVAEFPRRIAAKKVPWRHLAAGVVQKRDLLLIVRRPPSGLLGGLWEFPGGPVNPGQSPEEACCEAVTEAVNLEVEVSRHLTQVHHVYTHFKLKMDVYICRYLSGRVRLTGPAGHAWVRRPQLAAYPFHKAMHKIFPLLLTT